NVSNLKIYNDDNLDKIITDVRNEFLSQQPLSEFNRLAATILVKKPDNIWHRGNVNGTEIAYPASCVKLFYMWSAIEWCKSKSKSIYCLDKYVRPMVTVSSNLDTGFVIDKITNTTNIDDMVAMNDTRWTEWYEKRLSTKTLLEKLNLYENQRILSKTYPTNSGLGPVGAEALIISNDGSNRLQPCCSASFMLYLIYALPAEEKQYIQSLLYHTLQSDQTSFGNGLPAATILHNKPGNAYDTVEDIAYMILPNKQEIILAAFSNGYKRPKTDFYILGRFAEMLLDRLKLDNSDIIKTTDDQDNYMCTTNTTVHTTNLPKDVIGNSFIALSNPDNYCIWQPRLEKQGLYAIYIWNPSYERTTDSINITLQDVYNTDDTIQYNQLNSFSRWIYVGDYLLKAGRQSIQVSLSQNASGFAVMNAIKFSIYPPLTDEDINANGVSCYISYYS
ncbi:unnamed protein product, partial [Didymodactylos carnosus]